jgi:hypothetical protein
MEHSVATRCISKFVTRVVVLGLAGATLAAHDMWIDATDFMPPAGKVIGLRLRVGQNFMGDPLARDPALINRFVSVDANGEKAVVGRDGADPAGLVRPTQPGLVVIGYFSNPSAVILQAQKFNEYLTEEGLEDIAALRAKHGDTQAEARERFVRCAKSLLLVGSPAPSSQHDRVLGFPLELVAERSPYTLASGDTLGVRLIYDSRPLPGALVIALNQDDPAAKVSARSDKAGRVRLPLAKPGRWLIKAVHMIPAPTGADHEWESFWASLTFQLAQAAQATHAPGIR